MFQWKWKLTISQAKHATGIAFVWRFYLRSFLINITILLNNRHTRKILVLQPSCKWLFDFSLMALISPKVLWCYKSYFHFVVLNPYIVELNILQRKTNCVVVLQTLQKVWVIKHLCILKACIWLLTNTLFINSTLSC